MKIILLASMIEAYSCIMLSGCFAHGTHHNEGRMHVYAESPDEFNLGSCAFSWKSGNSVLATYDRSNNSHAILSFAKSKKFDSKEFALNISCRKSASSDVLNDLLTKHKVSRKSLISIELIDKKTNLIKGNFKSYIFATKQWDGAAYTVNDEIGDESIRVKHLFFCIKPNNSNNYLCGSSVTENLLRPNLDKTNQVINVIKSIDFAIK